MKTVHTTRFAIVKKGGQYVKPFIDDSPYLFFKTKREAEQACTFDMPKDYKVIKVRITVEPVNAL
jgi:hypothetical protein